MTFLLRKHYGYTEEEIYDYIATYGRNWVYESYKQIMEQDYREKSWGLAVAQVSQTPQSKKGAKQHSRYVKKLNKSLERQVPWLIEKRRKERARRTGKPQSKVILEGNVPPQVREFYNSLKGVEKEERK